MNTMVSPDTTDTTDEISDHNLWLVYIIESSDGKLYTGITNNIEKRWQKHKHGTGAKFFRARTPKRLCFIEANHDRSSASIREAAIKKLSRLQKQQLISSRPEPEQIK